MPSGVYKHKKGRKITWGDKISKALKGRKLSKKHIKKLSEYPKKPQQGFQKGHTINLGKKHSKATKRKISKSNSGKVHTKKQKQQNRESHLGKKCSLKTKKNMSKSARKGKDNHFWQGGISTYKRKLYLNNRRRARKKGAEGSHTQKEWEDLKKKYNYTCLDCKKKEPEIKLTEDHIVPLNKNGSDNIDNIQPLCKNCNSKKYTKIVNFIKE